MSYTLITGGASSGKSAFAVSRFKGMTDVSFIATGTRSDPEMEEKIREHTRSRPREWETIEEATDLIGAVKKAKRENHGIIIDCITFWVSNLIREAGLDMQGIKTLAAETACFFCDSDKKILVVTNELGMGIVPESEEVRRFRTAAGEVNRIFAEHCKEAYLVVSGLGLRLR